MWDFIYHLVLSFQGQALVDLTEVFKKHLQNYHSSLLMPSLPNKSSGLYYILCHIFIVK